MGQIFVKGHTRAGKRVKAYTRKALSDYNQKASKLYQRINARLSKGKLTLNRENQLYGLQRRLNQQRAVNIQKLKKLF